MSLSSVTSAWMRLATISVTVVRVGLNVEAAHDTTREHGGGERRRYSEQWEAVCVQVQVLCALRSERSIWYDPLPMCLSEPPRRSSR